MNRLLANYELNEGLLSPRSDCAIAGIRSAYRYEESLSRRRAEYSRVKVAEYLIVPYLAFRYLLVL